MISDAKLASASGPEFQKVKHLTTVPDFLSGNVVVAAAAAEEEEILGARDLFFEIREISSTSGHFSSFYSFHCKANGRHSPHPNLSIITFFVLLIASSWNV